MKKGWEAKPLGELCYLAGRIGWKGLTAKEYTKEGPFFLSVHGLNYGDYVDFRDAFHISQARYDESPEIKLRTNDVLLCKDGAGIGKVGIVNELPGESTINSSLLLLRAENGLAPKYLYFALCSPLFQDLVRGRINGATTPHLYQRDIRELRIPLPDAETQQRIVRILDDALEGIATAKANAEKNLANAEEILAAELNLLFGQEQDGWLQKSIADVCTLKSGTTVPVDLEQSEGDVPYLKVADMSIEGNEDRVSTSSRFIKSSDLKGSWVIPSGSVIFPKRGGAILTNKKRLTTAPVCLDLNIMSVQPNGELLSEFLYLFFLNVDMRKLGSGSSIPQINNYDIAPMKIAFPESLQEQREVCDRVNELRAEVGQLRDLMNQKIAALDALKQSLLREAFSGRL